MNYKIFSLLCAVVLLPVAAETRAATKEKAPAAAADAPIYKIADQVMGETELEALLKIDLKNQHMQSFRPLAPDFDKLLGQHVDRALLVAEAGRLGLDRQVAQGVFRLQKNFIVGKDFLRKGLRDAIKVDPAAVEARVPKELRYFSFRQIVLETRDEAETCAKELAAGADFVAMIKERSIGPEARKDGMLWRYRAGDGIFPEDIETYLFSLPLGVYSKVFEFGIGFAVTRLEKIDEPPAGTREKLRAKIENRMMQKQFDEERQKILKSVPYSVMDRDRLAPLVADWKKGGKISDEVVVEIAGDTIRFSEMVTLEKAVVSPPGSKEAEDPVVKFMSMGKSLAAEHIVAREAERRGYVLSEKARKELEKMQYDLMLEALYAKQVGAGVAVTQAEVRATFDKEIAAQMAAQSSTAGERKLPVFEEVNGAIEQLLLEQRRVAARDAYMKELRKGVKYFDENLAKFRTRFIKTNMASQSLPKAAPPSHGKP